MVGADCDARRHEPVGICHVGGAITAEVEAAEDSAGGDAVGAEGAGHAGACHDGGIRALLEEGVDEHGLGGGFVKGFAHDAVSAEDGGRICGVDAGGEVVEGDVGVDFVQALSQGLGFEAAEVGGVVLLPVEVAELDAVEIDQEELTHAGACERHGDVGPQAAQPGDGDSRRAQLVVHGAGVPLDQCLFKFFCCWYHLLNLLRQSSQSRACRRHAAVWCHRRLC